MKQEILSSLFKTCFFKKLTFKELQKSTKKKKAETDTNVHHNFGSYLRVENKNIYIYIMLTLAHRRERQIDPNFQASQGYLAKSCLKTQQVNLTGR